MTPTQKVPTMLVSASLGKTDNLQEQERKHQERERTADDNATSRIIGADLPRGFLKSKQLLLKVLAAGVPQADTTMDSLFADPATATSVGRRIGVLGYYAVGRVLQIGKGVLNIKNECLYVVADWTPRIMLVTTDAQAHFPRQARRRRTDHGQFVELMVLMVVNIDVLVPVPEGVEPRLASLAADWLAMICHGVHSGAKASHNLKSPRNDAGDENPGNDTRENVSSREPKVLVYGADGPGMVVIQIAKNCGAEVYACDPTPHNRMLAMRAINRLGSVFAPEEVEEGQIPVEVDIVIDMVHDDESMRVGGALISWTQEIKHWAVLFNRPNIWEWATKNSEAMFSKVVSLATVRHENVTKRDIENALQFLVDAPPYPAPRASTSQRPTRYNIHYILLDLEAVSGEGRAVVTFPTQLAKQHQYIQR